MSPEADFVQAGGFGFHANKSNRKLLIGTPGFLVRVLFGPGRRESIPPKYGRIF